MCVTSWDGLCDGRWRLRCALHHGMACAMGDGGCDVRYIMGWPVRWAMAAAMCVTSWDGLCDGRWRLRYALHHGMACVMGDGGCDVRYIMGWPVRWAMAAAMCVRSWDGLCDGRWRLIYGWPVIRLGQSACGNKKMRVHGGQTAVKRVRFYDRQQTAPLVYFCSAPLKGISSPLFVISAECVIKRGVRVDHC